MNKERVICIVVNTGSKEEWADNNFYMTDAPSDVIEKVICFVNTLEDCSTEDIEELIKREGYVFKGQVVERFNF